MAGDFTRSAMADGAKVNRKLCSDDQAIDVSELKG